MHNVARRSKEFDCVGPLTQQQQHQQQHQQQLQLQQQQQQQQQLIHKQQVVHCLSVCLLKGFPFLFLCVRSLSRLCPRPLSAVYLIVHLFIVHCAFSLDQTHFAVLL